MYENTNNSSRNQAEETDNNLPFFTKEYYLLDTNFKMKLVFIGLSLFLFVLTCVQLYSFGSTATIQIEYVGEGNKCRGLVGQELWAPIVPKNTGSSNLAIRPIKNETSFPTGNTNTVTPTCSMVFQVNQDMKGPVYILYQISNLYINHRKLMMSFSQKQLEGEQISEEEAWNSCWPIIKNRDTGRTQSYDGKLLDPQEIANPCGLKAYFSFNDSFQILSDNGDTLETVQVDTLTELDRPQQNNSSSMKYINTNTLLFKRWMESQSVITKVKQWAQLPDGIKKGKYLAKIALIKFEDPTVLLFGMYATSSHNQKKSAVLAELQQAVRRKVGLKSVHKTQVNRILQDSVDRRRDSRRIDTSNNYSKNTHGGEAISQFMDRDIQYANNRTVWEAQQDAHKKTTVHEDKPKLKSQMMSSSLSQSKLHSLVQYALSSAQKIIKHVDIDDVEAEFTVKLFKSDKQRLLTELNKTSFQGVISDYDQNIKARLESDNARLKKELAEVSSLLQSQTRKDLNTMSPTQNYLLAERLAGKAHESIGMWLPKLNQLIERQCKFELLAEKPQSTSTTAQLLSLANNTRNERLRLIQNSVNQPKLQAELTDLKERLKRVATVATHYQNLQLKVIESLSLFSLSPQSAQVGSKDMELLIGAINRLKDQNNELIKMLNLQETVKKQSNEPRQVLQQNSTKMAKTQAINQLSQQAEKELRVKIYHQVQHSLIQQITAQIYPSLKEDVTKRLIKQIEIEIRESIWDEVSDRLEVEAQSQLRTQVTNEVKQKLERQVTQKFSNEIEANVRREQSQLLASQMKSQIEAQVIREITTLVMESMETGINLKDQKSNLSQSKATTIKLIKDVFETKEYYHIIHFIKQQVETEIRQQFQYSMAQIVKNECHKQLQAKFKQQLKESVREKVELQLIKNIKKQSSRRIATEIERQLRQSLTASIKDSIDLQIREELRQSLRKSAISQIEVEVKKELRQLLSSSLYESTKQTVTEELKQTIKAQQKDRIYLLVSQQLHQSISNDLKPVIWQEVRFKLRTDLEHKMKPQIQQEIRIKLECQIQNSQIAIRRQVQSELKEKITQQMRPSMTAEIRADIKQQFRQQMTLPIKQQVQSKLREQFRTSLYQQVQTHLRRELSQAMKPQLNITIHDEMRQLLQEKYAETLKIEVEQQVKSKLMAGFLNDRQWNQEVRKQAHLQMKTQMEASIRNQLKLQALTAIHWHQRNSALTVHQKALQLIIEPSLKSIKQQTSQTEQEETETQQEKKMVSSTMLNQYKQYEYTYLLRRILSLSNIEFSQQATLEQLLTEGAQKALERKKMERDEESIRKREETAIRRKEYITDGLDFKSPKDGVIDYQSPRVEVGGQSIISNLSPLLVTQFGNNEAIVQGKDQQINKSMTDSTSSAGKYRSQRQVYLGELEKPKVANEGSLLIPPRLVDVLTIDDLGQIDSMDSSMVSEGGLQLTENLKDIEPMGQTQINNFFEEEQQSSPEKQKTLNPKSSPKPTLPRNKVQILQKLALSVTQHELDQFGSVEMANNSVLSVNASNQDAMDSPLQANSSQNSPTKNQAVDFQNGFTMNNNLSAEFSSEIGSPLKESTAKMDLDQFGEVDQLNDSVVSVEGAESGEEQ